jgi:hypothetical protein
MLPHICHSSTWTLKEERPRIQSQRDHQLTSKGKPIGKTSDVSTETLKTRRVWNDVFQVEKENNFQLILPTQKILLSFII